MMPDGTNIPVEVLAMYNEDGEPVESCPHSKQVIDVVLSQIPQKYDILRVQNIQE